MNTEISVVSHTIVRNGMPFIDLVLRQVEPYMNRMLITVSEKSTDSTLAALRDLEKDFPKKVRIDFENVSDPSELTMVRQNQVDNSYEDWILFLDDDDWWPKENLDGMMRLIKEDIDAYAVSPIQVIDQNYYDKHWYEHKFFTKWFRNKDITYINPWPRDSILMNGKELYWKKNLRTRRLYGLYLHLSGIKPNSFRNEEWSKGHYDEVIKNRSTYPRWCKPYIETIYERLNRPN